MILFVGDIGSQLREHVTHANAQSRVLAVSHNELYASGCLLSATETYMHSESLFPPFDSGNINTLIFTQHIIQEDGRPSNFKAALDYIPSVLLQLMELQSES